MRLVVHLQVDAAQHAARLGKTGTAQHRVDPRDQLLETERLHEIVVAAEGETSHLVVGGVARGEEQHGYALALGAKPAADLEAVEVGEHHVEHDQIGLDGRHGRERVAPVGHRMDVEAEMAQGRLEHRAQVVFIVDKEQAFTGHDSNIAPLAVSRVGTGWE